MTGEFMREERYIVFKMSDLGNSLKGDEIRRLAREYAEQRRLKGKKPLECVVVEKDWPEYEPTWKAIEARVNGAQPAPSIPEFCPCCGNIMRACMYCPNEDCNAVTATAEQSKYNKQHALARKASGAAEPTPEAKP